MPNGEAGIWKGEGGKGKVMIETEICLANIIGDLGKRPEGVSVGSGSVSLKAAVGH